MIIVLDNIRSALNVGSIIRTCDAFGINEIYFCGITPQSSNPKVLKTSLGAEKGIKETYFNNITEAIETLKKADIPIIALETGTSAIDISEYKPPKEFALIIGNEVSGISQSVLEQADAIVEIPMKGSKESLNVSVAFGIALFALTNSLE